MIYCFSGTGNSLYVAEKLLEIDSEDSLGFVFPIYAWGATPEFVKNVAIINNCGKMKLEQFPF